MRSILYLENGSPLDAALTAGYNHGRFDYEVISDPSELRSRLANGNNGEILGVVIGNLDERNLDILGLSKKKGLRTVALAGERLREAVKTTARDLGAVVIEKPFERNVGLLLQFTAEITKMVEEN
ncbi:MAG: hypothetical protein AABW63_01275 [Nanoarchaeota archaeon]